MRVCHYHASHLLNWHALAQEVDDKDAGGHEYDTAREVQLDPLVHRALVCDDCWGDLPRRHVARIAAQKLSLLLAGGIQHEDDVLRTMVMLDEALQHRVQPKTAGDHQ